MDTVLHRKQTAFRLNEALLDELKIRAAKCNRSLNNYVESLLMEIISKTPNSDTIEAINQTRAGHYEGTLDVKDFDSFLKTIETIK